MKAKRISRRNFLKASAATGTAVILLQSGLLMADKKNKENSEGAAQDAESGFFKYGCAGAMFSAMNKQLGAPKDTRHIATDSWTGIILKGHQCGMLWGASLAAGTAAYSMYSDPAQVYDVTIASTKEVISSFSKRAGSCNCRDITGIDMSHTSGLFHYLLSGKFLKCKNLCKKAAPETLQSIKTGLYTNSQYNQKIVNCASEVVKKMGGSSEQMAMVAGFSGGLGLSGQACGALAAALWMNTLAYLKSNPNKKGFPNPKADQTLKAFNEFTGSEMLCHKICGRNFITIQDHSNFIINGGCEKIIQKLTES